MANNASPDPQLRSRAQESEARNPEDRSATPGAEKIRDKMLDKTLADSFPTSDPPSSIPDPGAEDSFSEDEAA